MAFPNVDWALLKDAYGWPAMQYQAWVRGTVVLGKSKLGSYVLYTDNVLELVIDGKRFFGGDFYSFRRAPIILHERDFAPHVVHTVDIRVVRDVRAMGGVSSAVSVKLEINAPERWLEVVPDSLLVADVVSGVLASDLASIFRSQSQPRASSAHQRRKREHGQRQ